MPCQVLSTPEEQIRQLREKVKQFTDFALAHEAWEASILNDDGPWFDHMPEELHDQFVEVQRLRDKALGI